MAKNKITTKICFTLISSLILFNAPSFAKTQKKEDSKVKQALSEYLQAFESGSFEKFKAVVTKDFFDSEQTEKNWKEILSGKTPSQKKSPDKVSKLETVYKGKTEVFARFSVASNPQRMSDWFFLKQLTTGDWKIDKILQDFSPYQK